MGKYSIALSLLFSGTLLVAQDATVKDPNKYLGCSGSTIINDKVQKDSDVTLSMTLQPDASFAIVLSKKGAQDKIFGVTDVGADEKTQQLKITGLSKDGTSGALVTVSGNYDDERQGFPGQLTYGENDTPVIVRLICDEGPLLTK